MIEYSDFQKYIYKKFSKYSWDNIKIENNCVKKSDSGDSKITLNNTQKFITQYFPETENGLLLWHSVGSGKTLTAVSVLSKYEKLGYNTLWITRSSLKGDLEKALNMIKLKKRLDILSYKQFSNVCSRKGENYKHFIDKARKIKKDTNDPFYKTIIVIDEVHKLYSKDLKQQEMHDIDLIEKRIFESYKNSKVSCKLLLMSATPISDNTMEIIYLLNLLIKNKDERFDIANFKSDYLKPDGAITKSGEERIKQMTEGLVSYIDMSKDPRKFAQVTYQDIYVPMSYNLRNCKEAYENCLESDSKKNCNNKLQECKEDSKNKYYQNKILNSKCKIKI